MFLVEPYNFFLIFQIFRSFFSSKFTSNILSAVGYDNGDTPPPPPPRPQVFDPLPTQRVPPLILFQTIYTNFEGERAPKKTRFFCQNFSKSAQKRLFLTVFSKICLRRRNNLVDLKKGRQNFRIFFENPPPLPSRKS